MIGGAAAAGMAAGYGVSDFLSGRASRFASPLLVLGVGRVLVLPVLAVAAPLTGHPTGHAVAWGLAAGAPLFLGFVGLFAALSAGAMRVAAPTIAVTSAGVPLAAGVALGAPVPALAWVGVAAAVIALVTLNLAPGGGSGRGRAFWYAAGGGAGLGLYTVAVSRTAASSGLWPLLASQAVAGGCTLFALVVAAWRSGRPVAAPIPGRVVAVILAGAAVELAGDVLGLVAARLNLALVGPALAVQPATTVLLACLVDRERIGRVQWVGLAAAVVAVGCLTTA